MAGYFRNMGRGEMCCTDCGLPTSCTSCCPTSVPVLAHDSAGAMKTKCGFVGWLGFGRFLRSTWAGSTSYQQTGGDVVKSVSGSYDYNPDDNTLTGDAAESGCDERSIAKPSNMCGAAKAHDAINSSVESCVGCLLESDWNTALPQTLTNEVDSRTGSGVAGSGCRAYSGTVSVTLSVPFTDALLIEKVQTARGALPGTWTGSNGAYRNLAADGSSYAEEISKSRGDLTGESLTVGNTYRLFYLRRWTPLVGVPLDGDEEFVEFEFTAGLTYAPEITPVFPTDNGRNSIVPLRWECGPFDAEEDGE